MLSNKCWSEFNFLKCDTSTPPSVASTDLAKYMTALSDKDDQSLLLELNSSVTSNGECVAADLPETSNSEMSASLTSPYRERPVTSSETTIVSGQNDIQGFNSYSSYSSRHFRRASYTLENPSPVLVAKMQKLQLENPEDQNTMHIPNTRLSNLDVVKNFNTGGLLSRCSTKVMTFEDLNMPSWEQSDVHTDITTSSKQSRNVDEHKLENGPRENWQQEINHLVSRFCCSR